MEEHRIGPHCLRISGDTATILLIGELQVEQVTTLLSLMDSIGGGQGLFFVCADVSRLHGMPPEARRIAGNWKGIGRAGGTAIVGATVITRTLVMLVSRASTLMSRTRKIGEIGFFKTEEEARVWLDTRRALVSVRA